MPLGCFGRERDFPPVEIEAKPRFFPSLRREAKTLALQSAAVDRHGREAAAVVDAGKFDVLFANSCVVSAVPAIARYCSTPAALYLQEPKRPLYEASFSPAFAALAKPGRSPLAPWYVRKWIKDRLETPIRRRQARDEWESAKAFRRILVNSYFSRESVLRAYALDAEVCYLGIDSTSFATASNPARDYLIGLGSFTHNKNIPFVIRAVACLPMPRPPLIWVGNTTKPAHYLEEVQALARQLGVDFQPRKLVPQAELTELLGGALAMLYAPRLEPFGYAPLEANACGTPVIAVAEGGVRETVRDGVNGLIVAPRPEAMAEAVQRLQRDPELVARLGRSARAVVETEWTLSAATDRLEKALTEVAGVQRGSP
jgi:glycosyltransferase involved in cell wall biosynthesis